MLDVLVVGGGPIGLACGIEAAKYGLRCLILEKGCLTHSIYRYPVDMIFFSTPDKIEIGGVPFVCLNERPTRREALEYYRRAALHWGLDLHTYEAVQALHKEGESFRIISENAEYHARTVVLATGFYDQPNLLGIPGEDLTKVQHFFDDPHRYAGRRVLVVGAANSAADAALGCWRKGAEVTMVVRQAAVSPRIKYWVKPALENRIKEGSIRAFFNSRLTAVRPQEVDILTPDGLLSLPNDAVLAMTGYHPNFDWLEDMGVARSKDPMGIPEYNPDTFESNQAGLYLAGTVCGGCDTSRWFIENSRDHAVTVMRDIAGKLGKL